MASWLVPFFPCWVNIEATLLDPFKNILPGALWSWSFPCFLRELLLLCVLTLGDVGEQGRGLLPSADKQDPILRALIMLSMHSRTTTQLEHQFPVDWAVSNRSRTPLSLSSRLPITPNPVTSVQKLLTPNWAPQSRNITKSIPLRYAKSNLFQFLMLVTSTEHKKKHYTIEEQKQATLIKPKRQLSLPPKIRIGYPKSLKCHARNILHF